MQKATAWQQGTAAQCHEAVTCLREVRRVLIFWMVLCCLPTEFDVVAQDATPSVEQRLTARQETPLVTDTITVTATKTRRDPVETTGEVNIIHRDEIDRVQARSLDDVLRYQPGVEAGDGPRRLAELPSIRGLSGPRVLATMDGVRLNYNAGHQGRLFLDVDALRQVEVVRGPNSALWGSGALGGVLAMSTVEPADFLAEGDRMGGQLKLGFQGVSDEWLTGAMLFGRLGADVEYLGSLTLRQAQDVKLGGGAGRLENSAEDLRNGLGKLIWRPARHSELRFSVQGFEEDGEVPAAPDGRTMPGTNPLMDRRTAQTTYCLGYAFDNEDNPYLRFSGFAYLTTLDIRRRRLLDDRPDATNYDTTGVDLRNSTDLRPSASHRHVLTYGFEYFQDRQRAEQDGRSYVFFPDADAQTVSLYVQDEISLGERLFIIPALRWDRFRNETAGQDDITDSHLSPKIGGLVKVADFLYLEANYAEGFRVPAFGELYISGSHTAGLIAEFLPNPELQPEKSRNVDVGLRLHREGVLSEHDRLLFKLAWFRNQIDDFIDADIRVSFTPPTPGQVPAPPQTTIRYVNVQKALIQGIEAELRWVFMTGLDVWASYTDIEGDDVTAEDGAAVPLANIQPRKGVIGVSYTHLPWDFTVGGRVQMVDNQDRVPTGPEATPGYSVYDVFASWQPHAGPLQGLRVDVGIDNLTDKAYRRHLAAIPEAGVNPKATISYARTW